MWEKQWKCHLCLSGCLEGLKEHGIGVFMYIWRMLGRLWRMISKLSYGAEKGWMKWESGLLYVDLRMNWTWFKGVHLMLPCVQSWVMHVWFSLAACLYILGCHKGSWLRIWLHVSRLFLKHMYLTMVLCFRSSKGLLWKTDKVFTVFDTFSGFFNLLHYLLRCKVHWHNLADE